MAERARAIGWREVLIVAAVAVAAVLALDGLATVIPAFGDVFRQTPIIVVGLVAITGLVLWRIAARRPPES